jgi:DNA-binding transcriptional regulator YiaG
MGRADDVLKDMILLHGKRVAKDVVGDLPAQMKQARRDIRSIEKTLSALSKKVDRLLAARQAEAPVPPAPEEEVGKARFTKRTLQAIRKRFGLVQKELAHLLEVGALTISSWERGRSRPRAKSMARIVALRGMSQAQVNEALGRQGAPTAIAPGEIRAVRERLGLSQAELARLVGVSVAAAGAWERGQSAPRGSSLEALAQVRDMTREQADGRLGRKAAAEGAGEEAGAPAISPQEVRQIRQAAGMSQRAMAVKLRVSKNTISNWETGASSPRAASVEKLLAMK